MAGRWYSAQTEFTAATTAALSSSSVPFQSNTMCLLTSPTLRNRGAAGRALCSEPAVVRPVRSVAEPARVRQRRVTLRRRAGSLPGYNLLARPGSARRPVRLRWGPLWVHLPARTVVRAATGQPLADQAGGRDRAAGEAMGSAAVSGRSRWRGTRGPL